MEAVKTVISKYTSAIVDNVDWSEVKNFITSHKVGVAVCSTTVLYGLWYLQRPKNLPPGPYGYPIIGSLPVMHGDFFENLKNLGDKYGDVFCLWFGHNNYFVYLNSYSVIKETYISRGSEFSNRCSADELFGFPFYDTIFSCPYDEKYKNCRKVIAKSFRNHISSTMDEAIQVEIEKLESHFNAHGMEENPSMEIRRIFANIILRILFSKMYDHNDKELEEFISSVRAFNEQFLLHFLSLFLPPIAKPLVWTQKPKAIKTTNTIREFVRKLLEESKSRPTTDGELKSLAQVFTTETSLPEKEIIDTILGLVPDSVETAHLMCYWMFAYILNYPRYQEAIAKEILDVKGGLDDAITVKDRPSMPVTESVIMEVLRLKGVIGVSNYPSQDTTIRGYNIPKYVKVLPVLRQAHYDPKLFPEPNLFKPERFIKDGKIGNTEGFMPFGIGRRMCIGEPIVRNEVFLLIANIIRKYEMLPSSDADGPPPLKSNQFMEIEKQFKIRLVPRSKDT